MHPIIAPQIFTLAPDFTALSLHVTGAANHASDAASIALLQGAVADLNAPWAEAHLEAWREVYRRFGAKPNRFPCSAEALRKRAIRDGAMRPANAVVDLYNANSLRFALPVGGEDAACYSGRPHLCRAMGDEPFDTMADGQPKTALPDAGEVIWRDDLGVTCRRWNWRQGQRTQLTEGSTDMWFVLERLDPMPLQALQQAAAELRQGLLRLSPAARVSMRLFDQANQDGTSLT